MVYTLSEHSEPSHTHNLGSLRPYFIMLCSISNVFSSPSFVRPPRHPERVWPKWPWIATTHTRPCTQTRRRSPTLPLTLLLRPRRLRAPPPPLLPPSLPGRMCDRIVWLILAFECCGFVLFFYVCRAVYLFCLYHYHIVILISLRVIRILKVKAGEKHKKHKQDRHYMRTLKMNE